MKYREFYPASRFELYATGTANWDLYKVTPPSSRPYLAALAKPGSGAHDCTFGPLEHLDNLTRQGIKHGYKRIAEQATA